jgi:hypothetical protein
MNSLEIISYDVLGCDDSGGQNEGLKLRFLTIFK